jgi:hypothetical protein
MNEKPNAVDLENGEKGGQRRRSSLTAENIRHGDTALNLIGDERVDLTDEDVSSLRESLTVLTSFRTNASAVRQIA